MIWLLAAAAGLLAVALLVISLRTREPSELRQMLFAQAAAMAVLAVALIVYVASEDDYRNDGTSRWAAYDAQEITVVAVVCCLLVAGFAVYTAIRRATLMRLPFVLGVAAMVPVYLTLVSMTN